MVMERERYLLLERANPKRKKRGKWGEVVQLLGLVLLGLGIGLEIVYEGTIFLIIITIGSVVFAIGTKIKGG